MVLHWAYYSSDSEEVLLVLSFVKYQANTWYNAGISERTCDPNTITFCGSEVSNRADLQVLPSMHFSILSSA